MHLELSLRLSVFSGGIFGVLNHSPVSCAASSVFFRKLCISDISQMRECIHRVSGIRICLSSLITDESCSAEASALPPVVLLQMMTT